MKADNVNNGCYVIAEAGLNHNGSIEIAKKLIDLAVIARADAVKFQTFLPDFFVASSDQDRLERLRAFALSFSQFEKLAAIARDEGVLFFSTPLDLESARFLDTIQPIFKIASGDNNYFDLIELVASFQKPTLISTGLTSASFTEKIVEFWSQKSDLSTLALMHCVSSYPVPANEANLSAINSIRDKYRSVCVGYSDHTMGVSCSIFAAALGARILEKHFTLDKKYSDFRDHALSADPRDMARLIQEVRLFEQAYGDDRGQLMDCESDLVEVARRSVAAAKYLRKGHRLQYGDLCCLRPGHGIPADQTSMILGQSLTRDVTAGEILYGDDFEP